jgi:hypothetical protein
LEITFKEQGSPGLLKNISPFCLRTPRDIYRFVKAIRSKRKLDNFKKLLQKVITSSKKRFIMFCTDDSFFYKDVTIPEKVIKSITEKPSEFSYRMYIGKNCKGFPDDLKSVDNEYYIWDYYNSKYGSHWNYALSVDATIYNREYLLKALKKYFYYDPSTLEGYGKYYVRKKKMFRTGTSPIESLYINLPINGVSPSTENYQGNVNLDFLKEKYMEGYELEYVLPDVINMNALIPEEIILRRSGNIIRILKNQISWEKRKN